MPRSRPRQDVLRAGKIFGATFQGVTLIAAALVPTGCSQKDLKTILAKHSTVLGATTPYQAVAGSDAASYFAKSFKDQTAPVGDILAAMRLAATDKAKALSLDDNSTVPEVDASTADLLGGLQRNKANYVPDGFIRDDASVFQPKALSLLADTPDRTHDTVTWNSSKADEFTISTLAQLPVRDQGQRGTCASFAGIGHLEAFLMKKYQLKGIDLSQQRFYYMSKPEHWSDGGSASQGGSNAGTGFAKSNGYAYQGQTYPPDSPSTYNIPLATDCPYNKDPGSNDLQIPQADGCKSGVAKVQDFAAWVSNWQKEPGTAQDIYDMLAKEDLPVAVASRLSKNWEENDGMITLAEADGVAGDTSHAAGHAYLVVGARKLNESQFPGEGGMCFIIRNSWGKGWGTNGTSCMTLAWFNHWRFPDAFPRVFDAVLDPDKFAAAKAAADKKPSGIAAPDPNTTPTDKTVPATDSQPTGRVVFLDASSTPSNDDMTLGTLWTDSDEFRKVLYKTDGTHLILRGLLADQTKITKDLILDLSGNDIKFYKNKTQQINIGSIDTTTHILTLCSRAFGQVCHLNYVSDSNELALGLTQAETERDDSTGPYHWHSVAVAGYGLDFSIADALQGKVDIRLVNKGVTTNPLRFTFSEDGKVHYQGRSIGSVSSFSLCNGSDYHDVCRLVVAGDQFYVFFKATK